MSRIDKEECTVLDIEWYGVDKKGNIGVFCSGGEANVPEFICADMERSEKLIEWFVMLKKSTKSRIHYKMTERARKVAEAFSDKGLYYFDSDDYTKYGVFNGREYYTKVSSPETPLKYNLLPMEIRTLLSFNFLDIDDFELSATISVLHAYAKYINKKYAFTDIIKMDKNKICFQDGTELLFSDFIKENSYVADRNISACHPFFLFTKKDGCISIYFEKRMLFRMKKDKNAFRQFQKKLIEFGYTTRDLS